MKKLLACSFAALSLVAASASASEATPMTQRTTLSNNHSDTCSTPAAKQQKACADKSVHPTATSNHRS